MIVLQILGALILLYFVKQWLRWSPPDDASVSVAEAWDWIRKEKGLQILDLRSAEDFARGHLVKARSLPLEELRKRLPELDASRGVLIYCRFGSRSTNALRELLKSGFKAKALQGGIGAWEASGYKLSQ
jgi:rhodanese-related sulfurtransferase